MGDAGEQEEDERDVDVHSEPTWGSRKEGAMDEEENDPRHSLGGGWRKKKKDSGLRCTGVVAGGRRYVGRKPVKGKIPEPRTKSKNVEDAKAWIARTTKVPAPCRYPSTRGRYDSHAR
jgi:hypothetical protein